jgi:hypothetical protein
MLENNIHTNSSTTTTTDCCFVECTTTTTLPCINPIDELFNIATIFSEVNGFNKLEALERVLDNGFILNSCGMCCPPCSYIFTNGEGYNYIIDAIFQTVTLSDQLLEANESNGADVTCCVNTYGFYIHPFPLLNNNSYNLLCCNEFTNCAESIFEYFSENSCETSALWEIDDLSTLLITIIGNGIVEQGTINGESQVCNIFEHMKDYFETPCFLDEFFTILEKGIVVDCTDGRMFISSNQTYLNNLINI